MQQSHFEELTFNPFPSPEDLEALAKVVELEIDTLRSMFFKEGKTFRPQPIRLCAACYGKEPYHCIEWQVKSVIACDHHKLRLLEKCPKCRKPFAIPALWEDGSCSPCSTPFAEMVKSQGESKRGSCVESVQG